LDTVSTDQSASLYIYKLNNGSRGFVTGYAPLVLSTEHTGFTGAVTSVDWNLNYKADTLYFGTSGSGTGAGRFFKIELGEDSSPGNWQLSEMINLGAPISIKPTVTVDNSGKHWVYFGSGRLETDSDTSLSQQEYLLGIRDDADTSYPIDLTALKDVTDLVVSSNGAVANDAVDSASTMTALETLISSSYKGWHRKLLTNGNHPSERNLSRHSLLGGALISTSYIPDTDLCTLGVSNLYALYYLTGTAYHTGFLGFGTAVDGIAPALAYRQIATGIAMAPALHIGERTMDGNKSDQVTAVVQDSNADIHQQALETESPLESGEISWREIGTCY
jgi:type IV pilus assembly protein PilY1